MHVCSELPACDFEPLSPHTYSTTLPVSFVMDTEQLPRHPPDSWIPLKHASQNEMWMDHYCPTWIHSAAEFQKHWPWQALSWDRILLAWFHYCSIRQGWVCITVWFPEQSHLAIPWSRKSLLAAVHWWCPTRQWIQSPLQAHQSAMNEDPWHAGTSDDGGLAQSLWTPAYLLGHRTCTACTLYILQFLCTFIINSPRRENWCRHQNTRYCNNSNIVLNITTVTVPYCTYSAISLPWTKWAYHT